MHTKQRCEENGVSVASLPAMFNIANLKPITRLAARERLEQMEKQREEIHERRHAKAMDWKEYNYRGAALHKMGEIVKSLPRDKFDNLVALCCQLGNEAVAAANPPPPLDPLEELRAKIVELEDRLAALAPTTHSSPAPLDDGRALAVLDPPGSDDGHTNQD